VIFVVDIIVPWIELKCKLRNLLRAPLFVVVACLSLAIGFGLNAAVCAVFKNIVLKPLPFDDPDRLMTVWEANPSVGVPQISVSLGNFADLQSAHAFDTLTAFLPRASVLTSEDRQEEIQGVAISAGIESVTGIRPQFGRDFLPSDFTPDAAPVVILSHDLWRNWMRQSADIIGHSVNIDRQPYTVIGVMPVGFSFPYPVVQSPVQVWFPSRFNAAGAPRKFHGTYVVGKLATGASRARATAELKAIAQRLAAAFPATNRNWTFRVVSLHELIVQDSRRLLMLLLLTSILILIIASTNNSIMWLSRHLREFRHLSLKITLGASRGILIRSLVLESIVLAIIGATIGLVFNRLAEPMLARFCMTKGWITAPEVFSVDGTVLIATFGLSLLIGALSGIVPAWISVRAAARHSISNMTHSLFGRDRSFRVHGTLACLQIALATMSLLVAATLLMDYRAAVASGFGRRTDQVIAAKIKPPDEKYGPPQQRVAFYAALLDRVRNLPATDSAAAISGTSLSAGLMLRVSKPGMTGGDQSREEADLYIVTPDYFHTVGARIAEGRDFTETDGSDGPPVVIISETLSRQLWQDENPVGKQLMLENSGGVPHTVIGVVHDIDHFAFSRRHVKDIYVPLRQRPWIQMWLLVNSPMRGQNLFSDLQRTAWDLDRETLVTSFSTFRQLQERELSAPQARITLLATLSLLALALTVLGVYGVIAYQGAQRTKEVALRIAVGATRTDVLLMFLRQSTLIAAMGVAAGVCAAMGANQLVKSMMLVPGRIGIRSVALTATLVFVMVLGASFVPAIRASWRDPVGVLKDI
jgi:putative ABC transport system permease protein